ncbi:NAD(P)H-hydrate dehydratase [Cereibacter changlensis]|uniref:NAD(P)H-hydrate dehydratase n=1 Tax=Cereibacter changlensis TaxID=402884 RepID=UPI0040348600
MREVLHSAQMRAIEAAAIASGAVTGLTLMERAGAGVVAAIEAEGLLAPAAVVLCGPGNNGGDGYVIARLLQRRGLPVTVLASAPPATADAQAMRALWSGPVRDLATLERADLAARPLVVDALFGGGLARDVDPAIWRPLAMAQDNGCALVAVDILSGLCADSGRVRSAGGYLDRPARLTVSFERPRLGHMLEPGASLSGALRVVSIGLESAVQDFLRDAAGQVAGLAGPGDPGKRAGHKYSHGHALILGGGAGHGGAARLAARAALRIGAGLVTLACPEPALAENAARLDAVMLRPLADAAVLEALLADARISALCLGPGLGLGPREAGLVRAALASRRPLVMDADALTLLARDPGLFALLHDRCVLTPHAGEFARLFPDLAERLAAPAPPGPAFSKLDACRAAAARAGCTVLMKGPDTVIAAPDGRALLNPALREREAAWLATAGAGDVLAGMIAGLLARGWTPLDAAGSAAFLHVEAARGFGPGLIAEDLPEELPRVFRGLGL